MNDFDFLREHGYGVVYGAEEVRRKIIELSNNEEEDKMEQTIENTVSRPFTDEELHAILAQPFLVSTDTEDEDDADKVGYTDAGTLH